MLDANLNRLREALRVVEEYFRFIKEDEKASIELKQMRHLLVEMGQCLGPSKLLRNRDTENDCFASVNRPEEMARAAQGDILAANFKRAQEASRVIEEYSKLSSSPEVSEKAKKIRFSLYAFEKTVGSVDNG
ncbi:MAG: thiamine-phosphate pyrophosphorylase [Fibrobacterota bacterium]